MHRVGLTSPVLLGSIAVVALLLAAGIAGATPASADDAATMSLSVSGSEVECSADLCAAAPGATFTLSVDADFAAESGYFLVQSFIDLGPDLTYMPTEEENDEVVWPDCAEGVVVRFQFTPETVNHGCLTGLIPPFPLSTYAGPVFEIAVTCSDDYSSTNVHLLPFGDELADTSGTRFGTAKAVGVDPKLGSVTVQCGEPPPPPTAAPITLPSTGNAPLGNNDGGPNIVLWFVIGTLALAGAAATGARSWREACRRQNQ